MSLNIRFFSLVILRVIHRWFRLLRLWWILLGMRLFGRVKVQSIGVVAFTFFLHASKDLLTYRPSDEDKSNEPVRPLVVHNNWIVGKQAKVYRFREHLMWQYDSGAEQYYSSQTRCYLTYANYPTPTATTNTTRRQIRYDTIGYDTIRYDTTDDLRGKTDRQAASSI